jgi:hypothetical protein
MLKELKALKAELDERELCASCRPDQPADPRLWLVLRDGDGRELRTGDIVPNDLRLLSEFLSGESVHRNMHDAETPLRDHAARLRTLLGLASATSNKE